MKPVSSKCSDDALKTILYFFPRKTVTTVALASLNLASSVLEAYTQFTVQGKFGFKEMCLIMCEIAGEDDQKTRDLYEKFHGIPNKSLSPMDFDGGCRLVMAGLFKDRQTIEALFKDSRITPKDLDRYLCSCTEDRKLDEVKMILEDKRVTIEGVESAISITAIDDWMEGQRELKKYPGVNIRRVFYSLGGQ